MQTKSTLVHTCGYITIITKLGNKTIFNSLIHIRRKPSQSVVAVFGNTAHTFYPGPRPSVQSPRDVQKARSTDRSADPTRVDGRGRAALVWLCCRLFNKNDEKWLVLDTNSCSTSIRQTQSNEYRAVLYIQKQKVFRVSRLEQEHVVDMSEC